ncbi:hypothetical protein SAMN05444339_11227 [Loktanella atrilutea]|uniref:Uncharacterized protein n=1 Tax=Loktanella atrilutea TaxID=366533 RepID=A0A1M5EBP0_LOKAT|nr:hypothetical protein [Loktanella atrilutea]SHF76544.1 hypothetical protein SAMN05444339_11227 [Loktanella atrilutea]
MSDGPRRRLPLPMDDSDEKILSRTLERGGFKSANGNASQETAKSYDDNKPRDAAPAGSLHAATPGVNDIQPESMFSRNDLRPQIGQASALAAAMAEVFAKLDPAARKYVKPASVLKDFLAEHDDELAKMFRESNAFK